MVFAICALMNQPVSATSPALAESRVASLLRQAPLEFARVVYGLGDRAAGRVDTMAAREVMNASSQGLPLTRERAEQRARGYLPAASQPHCPRCWVFRGAKAPLLYREQSHDRPESAGCRICGAEYTTSIA